MSKLYDKGKQMSYLLRHNPEGLVMDNAGFVFVSDLITKIDITESELDIIVETNNKGRFGYDETKTKVRALQGHSIKGLELDMKIVTPPDILYHGTSKNSLEKIKKSKHIDKMQRQYVHLTDNKDTAYSVGKRYSKNEEPVIIEIYAKSMYEDGYIFKLSDNGVYQVDSVPIEYFKVNNVL